MIRLFPLLLLSIALLASCTSDKKPEDDNLTSDSATTEDNSPVLDNETDQNDPFTYITKSGKQFVVELDTTGPFSLQSLYITTRGFAKEETYELKEIEPVEDIFLADLNKDGFEELYITTRSVGSGGYSSLYGYSSNKDKSVSPIFIPDLIEMGPDTEGLFEGFSGHNSYALEEGRLMNSFPVYLPGDSNAEPTGGESKVFYRLEAGEAGWELIPQKGSDII